MSLFGNSLDNLCMEHLRVFFRGGLLEGGQLQRLGGYIPLAAPIETSLSPPPSFLSQFHEPND